MTTQTKTYRELEQAMLDTNIMAYNAVEDAIEATKQAYNASSGHQYRINTLAAVMAQLSSITDQLANVYDQMLFANN